VLYVDRHLIRLVLVGDECRRDEGQDFVGGGRGAEKMK
jgi:hypothetical protein